MDIDPLKRVRSCRNRARKAFLRIADIVVGADDESIPAREVTMIPKLKAMLRGSSHRQTTGRSAELDIDAPGLEPLSSSNEQARLVQQAQPLDRLAHLRPVLQLRASDR